MKRWYASDVMTREVITATPEMGYKELADRMVNHAVSALPVVDADGRVLGVVSEADLLAKLEYGGHTERHPLTARRFRAARAKAAGDTARELMTAPAVTVRVTETVTVAARRLDAARVRRLPVIDNTGRLVGILSRRDLVGLYTRSDKEIQATLEETVVTALWLDPSTVDITIADGIVTLTGQVDRRTTAAVLVNFVHATPGVVDVVDRLRYEEDDGELPRH